MLIKAFPTMPLSDLSNMVPLTHPSCICTVCTKTLYVMWFFLISMSLMKKVLCVQKIKDSLLFFLLLSSYTFYSIYPSQPLIFLSFLLLFRLGKIYLPCSKTKNSLVGEGSYYFLFYSHIDHLEQFQSFVLMPSKVVCKLCGLSRETERKNWHDCSHSILIRPRPMCPRTFVLRRWFLGWTSLGWNDETAMIAA